MINENLIRAIYSALVNSIWQGAILALAAAVIMLSTRRSPALLRYNLLLAGLGLFVAAVVCTFCIGLNTHPASSSASTEDTEVYISAGAMSAQNIIQQLKFFFDSNALWVVMCWSVVIAVKTIQLWFGLSRISSIKSRNSLPAGKYWDERIEKLAVEIGTRKLVALSQSSVVRVPLTAGFWKPFILVPAGILASLPPDEMEAILLHELAHIRRNDFLINIIHRFIQILFFFNPGVWWICSLLNSERENCCDDIVIKTGRSKINYLHALVSFHEMQSGTSPLAPAITGRSNSIVERAKRIILNRNQTLHTMEKTVLSCTLLIAGLFTIAFSSSAVKNAYPSESAATILQTANNNLPAKNLQLFNDTVPEKEQEQAEVKEHPDVDSIDITEETEKSEEIEVPETIEKSEQGEKAEQREKPERRSKHRRNKHENRNANRNSRAYEEKEFERDVNKRESEVMRAEAQALQQEAEQMKRKFSKDFDNTSWKINAEQVKAQAEAIKIQMLKMNQIVQEAAKNAKLNPQQIEAMTKEIREQTEKQMKELNLNVEEIRLQAEKAQQLAMQSTLLSKQFTDIKQLTEQQLREKADLLQKEADKMRQQAEQDERAHKKETELKEK